MTRVIFRIARILIGAIGLWWLVIGFLGIVMSRVDHSWRVTFISAAYMLVGFCLLYGAVLRFPWEPKRAGSQRHGEDAPENGVERKAGE